MNNASTAMKIGAGILLTVALISLVIIIYQASTGAAIEGKNDFANTQAELSDQKYDVYESSNLTGSEVVNAIRKFGRKADFKITIKTFKDSGGTTYTKGDSGETKNVTSSKYVNPSGIFMGKLDRDANSVVTGITFTQQ
ncbi:MAG: ABC transporter permease [Bacillota bacterium]